MDISYVAIFKLSEPRQASCELVAGELEDTAMEDLAVQSVENVPDMVEVSCGDMVEVVCGDKSYHIPVDKLAAKSQFFARAFEVPMAEKMWRKVVLKDFDEKVFEKVVKYMVEDLFLFDMQTEAGKPLKPLTGSM